MCTCPCEKAKEAKEAKEAKGTNVVVELLCVFFLDKLAFP